MTTPKDIREARARLAAAGSALRDRPRERTVDAFAQLLDAWHSPGSTWQKRLVDALPGATGFEAETVREGLARGLEHWTGDALREVVAHELGSIGRDAEGFAQTSVLLAGSIPMPTITSLMAPLLLHSPVLAKPASRDPVTARLFAECLCGIDPALGAAIEVVPFASDDPACAEAFFDAGCVVATGSDETVAKVSRQVRSGARLVTHGHRMSVAVVGPEHAEATALDVALWDQLGCLSPVAAYCEEALAEPFAQALAEALEEIEKRLPRGELPTSAAAAIRRERDEAEMRRAGGGDVSIRGDEALRWTVVREADATWRPAPLHRFVRVHPIEDGGHLLRVLEPVSSHLAGIATDLPEEELASLGAARICKPGTLQIPPLGWHHDGQPLLAPLAHVSSASG
jgi:hypothetical protein